MTDTIPSGNEQRLPAEALAKAGTTNERKTIINDLMLALRLAWNFGYIIAIPAVAFGFGGAYLDKAEGSSPLFLLLGLALAMGMSGIGVYRRVKEILRP